MCWNIVNNEISTSEKKNTDNFILERNEGGYWKNAGDDIEKYRIELWDNFHPEGYKVPCCMAPRSKKIEKGWDVDVRNIKNNEQWDPSRHGIVNRIITNTNKTWKLNMNKDKLKIKIHNRNWKLKHEN